MAIPGNDANSDWRTVQSDLRVQLRGPFQSVEHILEILLPTLHILDLVPPQIDQMSLKHTPQRALSTPWQGLGEEAQEEWRTAFSSRAWLSDVQAALLGPITQDWKPRIDEELGQAFFDTMLQAFFNPEGGPRRTTQPNSGASNLIQVISDDSQISSQWPCKQSSATAAAKMSASGVQAFSSALSRRPDATSLAATSGPRDDPHSPDHALFFLLAKYSEDQKLLKTLVQASHAESNAAKRQLHWQDTVRVLTSLPIRILNAFRGDVDESWRKLLRCFTESLHRQFFVACAELSSASENGSQDWTREALASLLAKFIRTGVTSTLPDTTRFPSDSDDFWATAIKTTCRNAPTLGSVATVGEGFRKVVRHLLGRDQREVWMHLTVYLDRCTRKGSSRGLSRGLIDYTESGKPAAIGKSFLSAGTAVQVEVVALLLRALGASASSVPPEDSESSDDETAMGDPGATPSGVLEAGVSVSWSLTMARAFVSLSTPARRKSSLLKAITRWGDPSRVRRTTIAEEHYLMTVILGCLAASRLLKSAQSKSSAIGQTLSRSKEFVDGVAAHLDHLNPEIRRMGMLLAEVVSEAAHEEQKDLHGESLPNKLEFGRQMWDGSGEGREEARVLRAYYHSSVVTTKTQEEARSLSGHQALEILGLGLEQKEPQSDESTIVSASSSHANAQIGKSRGPSTRLLPERRPPLASGGLQRPQAVQIIDSEDAEPWRAPVLRRSGSDSEDDQSSVASDSSDDDKDPAGVSEPAGPSAQATTAAATAFGGAEKDDDEAPYELYNHNKPVPRPVYISDLTHLLQKSPPDRDSVRAALKFGEALIRRKAHYTPMEVQENAIDLTVRFASLHNTLRIHDFDARRAAVLQALAVSSPRLSAGALIEQFFGAEYSMAQRIAILNALAAAARELAGLEVRRSHQLHQASDDHSITADLADDLSNVAITKARKEGEGRVPEIRKEQAVRLTSQRASANRMPGKIQEIGSIHSEVQTSRISSMMQQQPIRYVDVASSQFLFPLMNRLLAHIEEASSRFSRLKSPASTLHTRAGAAASEVGWNSTSLFEPRLLCSVLDTLSVLLHAARNSLDFLSVVAPEGLRVALTVVTVALPLSVALLGYSKREMHGAVSEEGPVQVGNEEVLGAAASLMLIVLDAVWELDWGRSLLKGAHGSLLQDVEGFAAQMFEEQDRKGQTEATVGAKMVSQRRAGRCSAAIMLRLSEMRTKAREDVISNSR